MAMVEVTYGKKQWTCYAIVDAKGLSFQGHGKYDDQLVPWKDIICFQYGSIVCPLPPTTEGHVTKESIDNNQDSSQLTTPISSITLSPKSPTQLAPLLQRPASPSVGNQRQNATLDFIHNHSESLLRRRQFVITATDEYLSAIARAVLSAISKQKLHRKYLLVINPVSGRRRGPRYVRDVTRHFHDAGIETVEHETTEAGEARRMLAALEPGLYDGVIVVGGDGFLNEAVLGLMTNPHCIELPVGVIAAGSTNTVARSCYGTDDCLTCALHAIRGREKPMDACRVVGSMKGQEVWTTYALNFVSSGFFSETLRRSEKCRCCGPSRYNWAGFGAFLRNKTFRAQISSVDENEQAEIIDENKFSIVGLALMALKSPDSSLGLVPNVEPGTGVMHRIILRNCGRIELLRFLTRTSSSGTQYSLPRASRSICTAFTCESEENLGWNVDGEFLLAESIHAEIEHASWKLIQRDNVPDESFLADYSALSEQYPLLSREQSCRTYRIAVV